MEMIPQEEKPVGVAVLDTLDSTKKKAAKTLLNYSSMIVGVFLVLVFVFAFTAELDFTSAVTWVELGLTFFVMIFCSYSMYINFSDSGTRAGRLSNTYVEAKKAHDELKGFIVNNKMQFRLAEFCKYYTDTELKQSREKILSNEGLRYDAYEKEYIGKDKATIAENKDLSKKQVKAIVRANNLKPIRLTPEMILKCGRLDIRRNPLGVSPESKKMFNFATKFITTVLTSVLTGVIVFNVIAEPSWSTVVACCLKVLPVILNGFMGYKMGYENVAVDTVNYMNDQTSMMQQFLQYVENHAEQTVDSQAPKIGEVLNSTV